MRIFSNISQSLPIGRILMRQFCGGKAQPLTFFLNLLDLLQVELR